MHIMHITDIKISCTHKSITASSDGTAILFPWKVSAFGNIRAAILLDSEV